MKRSGVFERSEMHTPLYHFVHKGISFHFAVLFIFQWFYVRLAQLVR